MGEWFNSLGVGGKVISLEASAIEGYGPQYLPWRRRNGHQYDQFVRVLDGFDAKWRDKLIVVSLESVSTMIGHMRGSCSQLQEESNCFKSNWCGARQFDLGVKAAFGRELCLFRDISLLDVS